MMKPTIHFNGTSCKQLLTQAERVCDTLRAALVELADFTPDGRDYYPQGSDATAQAGREHRTRVDRVRSVLVEIEELYVYLADQEN